MGSTLCFSVTVFPSCVRRCPALAGWAMKEEKSVWWIFGGFGPLVAQALPISPGRGCKPTRHRVGLHGGVWFIHTNQ